MNNRTISKSKDNIKQFFSFLQVGDKSQADILADDRIAQEGIGFGSYPTSRSVSYEASINNPWKTENSMLKSLLQRILSELNCESNQSTQLVLNSSEKLITIDMMLDIQNQILSSIQKLKQKSTLFTLQNSIEDDLIEQEESMRDNVAFTRKANINGHEGRDSDLEKDDLPILFSFEWQNCLEIHAPPPFDLESPVVQHIFDTWTSDQTKINFLKEWILNLSTTNYNATPIGIQITNISKVLRDAFVMLIIPIMRRRSLDPLSVMIRERFLHSLPAVDPEHLTSLTTTTTTAHQIVQKTEKFPLSSQRKTSSTAPSISSSSASVTTIKAEMINADPFVTPEHSVFDIRIKRVVSSPVNEESHPFPSGRQTSSPPISSSAMSNSPQPLSKGASFENQFHEITSQSPTSSSPTPILASFTSASSLSPHRIISNRPHIISQSETSLEGKDLDTVVRQHHFTIETHEEEEEENDSVHSKEAFPITDLFQSFHTSEGTVGLENRPDKKREEEKAEEVHSPTSTTSVTTATKEDQSSSSTERGNDGGRKTQKNIQKKISSKLETIRNH